MRRAGFTRRFSWTRKDDVDLPRIEGNARAAQAVRFVLHGSRFALFHTPVAGGPVDKKQLTQVGRALKQLGIRHIPSYTPEGRGRMERVFRTLQQRLPPMLHRAGILTTEAANIYLPF